VSPLEVSEAEIKLRDELDKLEKPRRGNRSPWRR
jgi:hypothetical protein